MIRVTYIGTGAPEPGGWTTREMIKILRGVMDLNIVGADIVEVAPAYDTPGGETAYLVSSLDECGSRYFKGQGMNLHG